MRAAAVRSTSSSSRRSGNRSSRRVKSSPSEGAGAPYLDELPAGVAPRRGVELEAAVDDALLLAQLAEPLRVELAELWPLGQVQHHLGAEQGLLHARHLGEALPRGQPGLRVKDAYVGTVAV